MSQARTESRLFSPRSHFGIPEITSEELHVHVAVADMVDVRRPEEFTGELGHVPGSILVEMGPDLENFLKSGDRNREIVFICRSGNRSGTATQYAHRLGYHKSINLQGGMIRWNELGFRVSKDS